MPLNYLDARVAKVEKVQPQFLLRLIESNLFEAKGLPYSS